MRYVLITWLPFSLTEKDRFKVDIDGWYWELKTHSEHFKDLHVFAPMKKEIIPDNDDLTNVFSEDEIKFHALPYFENPLQFMIKLPRIVSTISNFIEKDDIIHNKATAIPPIGHIVNYVCMLRGYKNRLLIYDADFIADLDLYMESSNNIFSKSFYLLLKYFYSPIFKFSIRKTPLTFVGGENLLERYKDEGNVIKYNTSWVKKRDIISKQQLKQKLENRSEEFVNLCFVASLIPKKNPGCAIEAAKILKERGIPCKLNILPVPYRGREETLEEDLEELVSKYDLEDTVKFWGILPYGDPFYEALREHDVILVPNLSGEEPRIIYDAMANGTVVIGADLRSFSIISNYSNGILCDPQNPACFADAVEKLYKNKQLLNEIAYKGLETMEKNSMESMHEGRKKHILKTFYNRPVA